MYKDILLDFFLIFVAKLPKKSNVKNEGLFIYLFVCLLILRYSLSRLMALQPVISSMRQITLPL